MTITVAIYARLSDDRDGLKVGVENQLEDCRRIASERGWNVVDEYVDRSISASKKNVNRPQYNRLVDDFAAGRFGGILCWDLDRLTRQPRQLEDWIDAAEDRGLRIVTANGEADLGNDNGRMFARLKATIGKNESERTSRRVKRNVEARSKAGKWHGGPPPFGFTAVDKSLVVVPQEAELIREAAARITAGDTMYGIVSDWNKKGIPTRYGNHWRQPNLRTILLNPSTVGKTKANVLGWEPILDQRTFDRVGKILTDPSRKVVHSPGVRGGKYSMGGGLTVCGECGKRLITGSHHGRASLKCTPIVNAGACGKVVIDHDRLEEYVFTAVLDSLAVNDRWKQRLSEPDPRNDERIDALERVRDDLRAQRQRADDGFIRGIIAADTHESNVTRIDAELNDTERQITDLLGTTVVSDAIDDGLEWREWSSMRRRNFLRALLKRVEVGGYPEGFAKTLPRRKNESEESLDKRRNEHHAEVLSRRVCIVT